MTKNKNINFLIVLAVGFSLILGSLLRLYNINYENLWLDEMYGVLQNIGNSPAETNVSFQIKITFGRK